MMRTVLFTAGKALAVTSVLVVAVVLVSAFTSMPGTATMLLLLVTPFAASAVTSVLVVRAWRAHTAALREDLAVAREDLAVAEDTIARYRRDARTARRVSRRVMVTGTTPRVAPTGVQPPWTSAFNEHGELTDEHVDEQFARLVYPLRDTFDT